MSQPEIANNSVFWIDVDKIHPNPYQPRKTFDESTLVEMSESVRLYGILQPLVVTRNEKLTEDGGMQVEYELIAGERRLRAAKLAGLKQVPATIRTGEQTDKMKLELAIIENLQRENLNPIDRAFAFKRLHEEFSLTHSEIGKKMGKSREYISNSLRLLNLPEEMQMAISAGNMSEGHARPLLMLRDNQNEQLNVFQEILVNKISVREAEQIARRVAKDKVRKPSDGHDEKTLTLEKEFSRRLGARVHIEKRSKGVGGKVIINYLKPSELEKLLNLIQDSTTSIDPPKVAATPPEIKPLAQEVIAPTPVITSSNMDNIESMVAGAMDEKELDIDEQRTSPEVSSQDGNTMVDTIAPPKISGMPKSTSSQSGIVMPINDSKTSTADYSQNFMNAMKQPIKKSELDIATAKEISIQAIEKNPEESLENPLQKMPQQPFIAPIPVPPPPASQ